MTNNKITKVYWLTGLSGAGKTTLATALVSHLRELGQSPILLDGDELRAVFTADTHSLENHGRDGRLQLAHRYSRLCKMLSQQGFTVVIATISMFREIHEWNRVNMPGYFEVYLKVPIEECRRRDPKGLYKRFSKGQISHIAGLDLEVDEPLDPDLLIDFKELPNKDQQVQCIIDAIN